MIHRSSGLAFVAIAASLAAGQDTAPSGALPAPNVVLVFVDDMGYGDIGSYADPGYATPNLDRLAREGVVFTDFYVAQPVCSASRAALLTGSYPNRIGIHGALGPESRHGLAAAEVTLGELFRSRGYATAAFGKWHLGHQPGFLPTRHGFDEFYGIPYSNDMWPRNPTSGERWPDLPTLEGERVVGLNTDQSRFTTDLTERAAAFVERSVAAGRPFFVYLAHPMPHVPLHVSAERDGASSAGLYGDVIAEIDWSVGRVLETLVRAGVDDRTLVIFASDNGPWLNYGNHAGSAGPLREGKHTTFEGGVRVPALMRWPGRLPAGSTVREPVMTIDVLPTLAGLIGAPLPELPIDGRDILPLMAGEEGATSPHEALFFYNRRNDLEAVRSGRWKLHFPHDYPSMAGMEPGADGLPGPRETVRIGLALYDLESDAGERRDVAAAHPDVVEQLEALADAMRDELGDRLTGTPGRANREPGRADSD
jgi:arylsulfatase A